MRLKQESVGSYYRLVPEKRLEIINDNYEKFPRIIASVEKNLKLLIVSARAFTRNRQRGELGVRIQTSGNYSPTETNAEVNRALEVFYILRKCGQAGCIVVQKTAVYAYYNF